MVLVGARRVVVPLILLLVVASAAVALSSRQELYEWAATEVQVTRHGEIIERARVWRWGERKGQRHGRGVIYVEGESQPRAWGFYRDDKTDGAWTLANQEGRAYWVEHHEAGRVASLERAYPHDPNEWPIVNEIVGPRYRWRYVIHDALVDDPRVIDQWKQRSRRTAYLPRGIVDQSGELSLRLDVESGELLLLPRSRVADVQQVLENQRSWCPRREEMEWRRRHPRGPTRSSEFRITQTIGPLTLPAVELPSGYEYIVGAPPEIEVGNDGTIVVRKIVAGDWKEKVSLASTGWLQWGAGSKIEPLGAERVPGFRIDPAPSEVAIAEWEATLHVTTTLGGCACGHSLATLRLVGDDGAVWWSRDDVAIAMRTQVAQADLDGDGEIEVLVAAQCHEEIHLHLLERVGGRSQ